MMFPSVAGKKTGQRQRGKIFVSCRRSVLINDEKMSSFLYQFVALEFRSQLKIKYFILLRREKKRKELIALYFETIFVKDIFLLHPTCGGRNYTLQWIFLFSQFWPIDIFIAEKCEWYH